MVNFGGRGKKFCRCGAGLTVVVEDDEVEVGRLVMTVVVGTEVVGLKRLFTVLV